MMSGSGCKQIVVVNKEELKDVQPTTYKRSSLPGTIKLDANWIKEAKKDFLNRIGDSK